MNSSVPPLPKNYPPLPTGAAVPIGRRLRVCIASPDFSGVINNGGIGTAYTAMADTLAAAGHEVTCLYAYGNQCASHDINYWIKQYRSRKITLVPLPGLGRDLNAPAPALKSYEAYAWLKQNDRFDVIHFPEWFGLGHYSLLAKKQGLAFAHTTLCVGIHSMTAWLKHGAREHLDVMLDLQLDFMERQSVALADVVVSPSQYLLNWIADRGWELPAASHVQQYLTPHSVRVKAPVDTAEVRMVEELVFFGRLETRKGIQLFCDALDRLPAAVAASLKCVTFLGKESAVNGVKSSEYLASRMERWPWQVQILSDRNQPQAVEYLRSNGRLAVIASQLENSPLTVYECLSAGIAFVACRVGGIPELIAPEDVETACFANHPAALAAKLTDALQHGVRQMRPAQDPRTNERAWLDWHLAQARPAAPVVVADPPVWPKVSLCLTTFNRPGLLRQALQSVKAITYPNLEVVLVDDGSTQPEAVAYLVEIEPDFRLRGWQIVRQENRYLGAARNNAARHATGELLLFMDDDNYAEPAEVTTLVRAMLKTGADILSCGMNMFSGLEAPPLGTKTQNGWLPMGAAASLGVFCNCFGDANSLVRRTCFEAVGGFTEDYGVTHEDWEFLARAVLKGFKQQVVPEFLFWYRVSGDSMLRTLDPYPNQMRHIRPYVEAMPPALRELVHFAQGEHLRVVKTAQELNPYARLTLQWRSKLEAGLMLVSLGQKAAGVQLMLDAVKSVETCRSSLVIVEAIIGVVPHLAPYDLGRARFLIGLAVKTTEKYNRVVEHALALKVLASLPTTVSSPGRNTPQVPIAVAG